MEWQKDNLLITDDTLNVDLNFVTESLQSTYWAGNRSRAIIEKSITNSVFLSLFDGNRQIGFNRIVSDSATFAWLCDFYIHPDYRGKGFGKWFFEMSLEHPTVKVRLVLLATKDAHALYAKYGFETKECMLLRDDSLQAATD